MALAHLRPQIPKPPGPVTLIWLELPDMVGTSCAVGAPLVIKEGTDPGMRRGEGQAARSIKNRIKEPY